MESLWSSLHSPPLDTVPVFLLQLQQALTCLCLGSHKAGGLWALWTAPPNVSLRGPCEPTGNNTPWLALGSESLHRADHVSVMDR